MRRSFAAAAIYAASAGMNRRTMHRVPTSSMLIVDHTHTLRAPQSLAQGASDVSFRGSYPSDFGDSFWPGGARLASRLQTFSSKTREALVRVAVDPQQPLSYPESRRS